MLISHYSTSQEQQSSPEQWHKVGSYKTLIANFKTLSPKKTTTNSCVARLSQVASHITGTRDQVSVLSEKHPDDVVVTCALRTPITKARRGGFKDTAAANLLSGVLKGVVDKSKLDPSLVDDIAVGSVLAPGAGSTEYRAAALVAGFPVTTALRAVNRQCGSGLQSVVDVANQIKAGVIDVGIGAGVESMTSQYG